MNKTLVKGLIMTALSFIAAAISTSGFPGTTLGWEILGITTVGTMIGYIAQSKIFPSTSAVGQIDWRDILKSVCVAASGVLSSFGAAQVTGTSIDWKSLMVSIGTLTAGYLVKQFVTPEPKSGV